MKCVCPMGGDRTCPDDCLLAVWANMPPSERKAKRKGIAEALYKQNFTQEQIATQLGVSQQTIARDVEGLLMVSKPPRPKGGRPKGKRSAAPRRKITDPYKEKIIAAADAGVPSPTIAADLGINSRVIHRVVQDEQLRREGQADPEIERTVLSMSAQEKLDAAIRQHKRKLDLQFEQRVLDEIKKRLDEMVLPAWKKQIAEARAIYHRRKGILKTKREYNLILGCLHPDSRKSVSDERLGEAFRLFNSLEKYMLDESQSPTDIGTGLPNTMAEWDRMRAAATATRKAKRNANPLRRQ